MTKRAHLLVFSLCRRAQLRVGVFLALLVASSLCALGGEEGESQLIQPADDLPYALIGEYRVDFTRNGAFVVSKDARYLFDGGLLYALPGWKEWGTQVRRASPDDTWQVDPKDPTKLATRGSLFDSRRNKHFSFVQEAEVVPGGLKFSYEITPLEKREIASCGVTLHFPIAETEGAQAEFWSGFATALMPGKLDQSRLYRGTARGATVFVASCGRVAVVGNGQMSWTLSDYRAWNVNAYWLTGSGSQLTQSLSKGEKGSMSFEVRLGSAAAQRAPIGAGQCQIDSYGRATVWLADRKIAEGGLAWGGDPPRWLHETAHPAEAPAGVGTAQAWQCVARDEAGKAVSHSAQLAAEQEGSATIQCTIGQSTAPVPNDGVRFVLAVPTSEVLSEPTEEVLPQGISAKGASGSDTGTPLHALAVSCRQGSFLVLETAGPWTVRSATIAGTDCYLLSVPARRADGGRATTWVRFRLQPRVAEEEGEPAK